MKRAVVLLIATGAFAGLASPAQGALTTESDSTTLDFGEVDVVNVDCAPSNVMSGGFSAPGLDPIGTEGHYILPFFSTIETGQSWHAEGYNGNPPQGTFIAYAKCSDAIEMLQLGTDDDDVAAGDVVTLNATCPGPSMDVVSGGFVMNHAGDYQFHAIESKRKDRDTWTIVAYNSGDTQRIADAYALCTNENLKLEQRSAVAKKKTEKVASATAACPKGDLAISGGWDGVANEEKDKFSYVFESRPRGPRKWKSSAAAYADAGKVTWKSLVYCVAANKVN